MSKPPQFIHKGRIPDNFTLIVPSRITARDLSSMESLCGGRNVIWLCEERVVLDPKVENFLSNRDAVAFSNDDENLSGVGNKLRAEAGENGIVMYIAGSTVAHNGTTIHIEGKTLSALAALGLDTVALGVHYPHELSLSTENSDSLPSAIYALSEPIQAGAANAAKIRQELTNTYEEAFSSRSFLNGSLAYAVLAGLKKHAKVEIVDGTNDQVKSYEIILGASLAFSKHICKLTTKKRIGIILPPGPGALIANIAALFAGKTPVNINFTSSKAAVASAIRQGDVDKFITADPFVRKLPDFFLATKS